MNVDDAAQLIRVKNLRGAGEIADALADAGLLLTDADRAVLNAAERDWLEGTKDTRRALHIAVRARREANQ